ncbi:MAG: NrpR regulatory domain-containing protein [Candidatus Hadarchaeota archaeon]
MINEDKVQRLVFEILEVLKEKGKERPIGARVISKVLDKRGFKIGERGVRHHLRILDDQGFTKKSGPLEGRVLTKKGEEEIKRALVGKRVGFGVGKIEELIYKMTYDVKTRTGTVIVNISYLDAKDVKKALPVAKKVIDAGYAPSPFIKIAEGGERIAGTVVPRGKIGIAMMCSVTIDGLLAKAGIPVLPKFGGLLEIEKGEPKRFTDVITYQGSSLDPLDVFASRKMTSYLDVLKHGSGRILANLREIPMSARSHAQEIVSQAKYGGLGGVLVVSAPGEPLYGLPVDVNKVGVIVMGGINPIAAVEESGIKAETKTIEAVLDIAEMQHIQKLM